LGFERQLKRADLPADLKKELEHNRQEVIKAIDAKSKMDGTELFAITYKDGAYKAAPFAGDAKTNSIQLWSYLRMIPKGPESSRPVK
jgi:hypothetical protein